MKSIELSIDNSFFSVSWDEASISPKPQEIIAKSIDGKTSVLDIGCASFQSDS